MPVDGIINRGYDLIARDPNRKEKGVCTSSETLLSGMIEREKQSSKFLDELSEILNKRKL